MSDDEIERVDIQLQEEVNARDRTQYETIQVTFDGVDNKLDTIYNRLFSTKITSIDKFDKVFDAVFEFFSRELGLTFEDKMSINNFMNNYPNYMYLNPIALICAYTIKRNGVSEETFKQVSKSIPPGNKVNKEDIVRYIRLL